MAVAFNKDIRRTSEYRALPEHIVVHPELNGRHDLPDIEWLIASILKDGQLQPVTIRRDGDRPVLVAGYSRWRAVSAVNERKLTDIPLQLRCAYSECTEQEGFLACITENRVRNGTTLLDDAFNIKRLMKQYAMTEEQVAAVYFPNGDDPKKAVAWVRKRSSLAGLTDDAQQAVRDGKLKETAAIAIAKLSAAQQREAISGDKPKATQAKPKETASAVKATARHRALVDVEKAVSDLEVFNRERVLKLIRDLAAKCDPAQGN